MDIELYNIKFNNLINRFSYKFESGKVTSILGKSASGKSLIGYIIMDLVKYDSGKILVDGNEKYDKNIFMKDVGYVFQNPSNHFFCDTVYEEIGFGLKQFRFKIDKIEKQIIDSLKMVGLDESYRNRKINSLSSGESFLVAMASSLVLNPKVLILDEPTVYLDYKFKKKLIKLIKMLRDRYHKSVIIMSNDINFVFDVSDKYLFMDNCKLIKSGNINELITNCDILKTFGYEIPDSIKFVNLVRVLKGVYLDYDVDIDKLVVEVVDNAK